MNPYLLFSFLSKQRSKFNIWTYSDIHDGDDLGRMTSVISQMDAETWDIGVNLGDNMKPDDDGDTVYQRYVGYYNGLSTHERSQIYEVMGNHDRTKADDPAGKDFYWQKYCDPFGLTPSSSGIINASRPYPVQGTLYNLNYIEVGNMLVIMIGDDNGGDPPGGESGLGSGSLNFRASGNITTSQWTGFKSLVENNTDKVIIVMSHHSIKDTTIGMGFEEFTQATWRDENIDNSLYYDVDDAIRRGYWAYINNTETGFNATTGDSDQTNEIDTWFTTYGQYIDLFCHGHYHRKLADSWAGRTRLEQVYDTRFLNCSTINTTNHNYYNSLLESKSNIISVDGNKCTVKTYIHHDPNSVVSTGYYTPEEFSFNLKKAFIK